MRLCRFQLENEVKVGLYYDDEVVDLEKLYERYSSEDREAPTLKPFPVSPIELLKSEREIPTLMERVESFYRQLDEDDAIRRAVTFSSRDVKILTPVPTPSKMFFLAGNYAEHIEEGGGAAEEKEFTFPYFFMKPPSTTLTNPGDPIKLPTVSPDHIDWEVELGVIIGRRAKGVKAEDALDIVAGYTVVNDVSDREFRPNPNRKRRDLDDFFDWLHGKWHDTFAPMGPCIASKAQIPDPQNLRITLRVNGETMQDSNTRNMIFSVAELIEFISNVVTLEPGDLISTGTPSGIGATRGVYLKSGDVVEAEIERIGVLRNPVQ